MNKKEEEKFPYFMHALSPIGHTQYPNRIGGPISTMDVYVMGR